jgi:tetratricopeptide (TPR) repeat protein
MKNKWIKYLLLLPDIFFLLSCGEPGSNKTEMPDNSNPALQHPAIKPLTEQINANPKDARLFFKRGMGLANLGEDTLALHDFEKAAALDSTQSEYFSAVGNLLFEHKDLENSVKWLKKALMINPRDSRAHLKLAKMLLYTQDFPKAFEQINIVLRQDAYNPEAYFLKGMIYKDMADTGKAISSFQSAIQSAPDYKDAVIQLGLLYSQQKNPLALQYLGNAFRMDSTDVFPLFAQGVYFQKQEQPEMAKEQYRNCIIRDPQYADAYYNMGMLLLAQDSFEKAGRQYDMVTKITPNDAFAYYNRGLCNEKMGHKQEAVSDYEQALVFNKDLAEAHAALKRLKK